MTTRILIAIAAIVAINLGFLAVHKRGEVVLPDRQPDELPLNLGDWQGERLDVEPQIFDAVGADATADRIYRTASGDELSLHVALFGSYYRRLQHHPDVCYSANGYSKVESKRTTVRLPSGKTIPADLVLWRRDDLRVQTLHWFQLGDQVLLEEQDLRPASWALRGEKNWPPLVKVLLQTRADYRPERSAARLEQFAALVYPWVDQNLCVPKAAAHP